MSVKYVGADSADNFYHLDETQEVALYINTAP